MKYFLILSLFLVCLLFSFVWYATSDYNLHLELTKCQDVYGPASFERFLEMFNKYNLQVDGNSKSYCLKSSKKPHCYVSEAFIRFENNHMYMSSRKEYKKFKRFFDSFKSKTIEPKEIKELWNYGINFSKY